MAQKIKRLNETPSQTAGPYVHIGCTPSFTGIDVYNNDLGDSMVNANTLGERISITGTVVDGAGMVLRDTMVEIWQADAAGVHNSPQETRGVADPNFTGWGRSSGNAETGQFRFDTIKPGRVASRDGRLFAPHITFWIVARGINLGLHTRMYFAEEVEANAVDPILTRIEHQNRVPTMHAQNDGKGSYRFDIILQGANETIFFDI